MGKDTCTVCKKLLKKGVTTMEGKKFCCQACCDTYKKGQKRKVCEFC